jgi:hypothetical protein
MTYNLADAIADELALLKEMLDNHNTRFPKKGFEGMAVRQAYEFQIASLSRIHRRYADGKEFYLGHKGISVRQTNKHLIREYPSVKEAQAALDDAVAQASLMEKLRS